MNDVRMVQWAREVCAAVGEAPGEGALDWWAQEGIPEFCAMLERVAQRLGAPGFVRNWIWQLGPEIDPEVPRVVREYFATYEARQAVRDELRAGEVWR